MLKQIVFPLVALLLAGCADNQAFADRVMMLQSEDCRERATQHPVSSGVGWEETYDGKETNFDRAYRACLSASGIQVAAPDS